MQLYSKNHSNAPGTFQLIAKNGTIGRDLIGKSTGELEWGGFPILTESNSGYRKPNTAYNVGQIVYHSALPTGWYLECTISGTSSSGELTIMSSFGSTVTDGTVTWTIGKSLSVNGGYMMGNILYDNRASSNTFVISGDVTPSKGAVLELLRESDNQTISSQWMLGSHWSESGTSKRCYLLGRKDNSLRWVRSDETQTDLAGSAIIAKSINTNGYIKYASGLIIQWGIESATTTLATKYYPISFSTNNSFQLFCNPQSTNYNTARAWMNTSIAFYVQAVSSTVSISWFAIGY